MLVSLPLSTALHHSTRVLASTIQLRRGLPNFMQVHVLSRTVHSHSVAQRRSKFPYGESSFKAVSAKGRFFVDKTSFIATLEKVGAYNQIWRPRRFGKTLLCNMLAEYYDAAGTDQLFSDTDIVKNKLTTVEMGQYLVLRLSFSVVSTDGDVKVNFCNHINNAVESFSEKYYKAGLLKRLVEIDSENCLSSLQRLFGVVRLSGRQIYLIVDECDAFVSRLLLSVDTSKPDLGLGQYELVVSDKESLLRNWGNAIKEGTVDGTIARAFFTGVVPQAFSDGLSSLNMVRDLTFDSRVESMFGLTIEDVSRGLDMIENLTEQQRHNYLEQMREQYDGYRFVCTQKEGLLNPQYVLYFLDHLDQMGEPPSSLIDPAVSGSSDNVAEFLVSNYKAGAPYTLRNFALGIVAPEEMGTFKRKVVPTFRSAALVHEKTVSASLISLAYYHGFLTFKPDKDQVCVLTSPNAVMQTLCVRALFDGLPDQYLDQLEAMLRTAKPDLTEFKRIVLLGIEEVSQAAGQDIRRSLFKVFGTMGENK